MEPELVVLLWLNPLWLTWISLVDDKAEAKAPWTT